MKHFTYLFLFFVFALTQFISAQIPHTISYQGILTDDKGNLIPDGNESLIFRLYNASEGGDTLWQETQQVAISKGIFNVALGSVEHLNLPFDQQYWLGITIEGNEELTPRTALTASPYSLNSHSTIAEPAPGQDLLIKNAGGEITHELSANGDVKHIGTGTFLSGIVVGDTAAVPVDTLKNKFFKNIKSVKKIVNDKAEYLPSTGTTSTGVLVGVLGGSEKGTGVLGQSHSGPGIYGTSDDYKGVYGESINGIGVNGVSSFNVGVVGYGPQAAVWAQGKLKINEVPPAPPDLDRFLVWDGDNFVKYRTLPIADVSFNGTLDDKPLILKDANGDTVFSVMTNGKSIHKGEETFLDGIKLTDANNGPGMFIWQRSITLFDKNGGGGGTWGGDYGFRSLKPVDVWDTLRVKDAQGNVVTMFAPDGTSLHKGDETFEGDVILKGKSGKGIKLVDDNGTTLAGFGRKDLDTGQRLSVYGRAQNPGDLAGAFQGDVEVRGEIAASSFHIVSANGDTLTDFYSDGTSRHKGLETYEAGLKVTNTDGSSAIELVPNTNPVTEYGLRVNGNVKVNGILNAQVIQAETKQFRIDDPLDPEHKYLNHTSVESSEMKNVYDGEVILDRNGEAVVSLPEWFQALNKDFRYQLTCIGGYAPIYVKEKIHNNRFKIAGGQEGLEVCWLVTGIRNDKFAREHRMKVITDK